jgi:hypothetical protein
MDKYPTLYFICMACTSPSHVQSLVNEGILDYWDRAVRKRKFKSEVEESIAHLTSIDSSLSEMIERMKSSKGEGEGDNYFTSLSDYYDY